MTKKIYTDAATEYARKVHTKEIMAGPGVRGACARHLDDLNRQAKKGFPYVYNVDEAEFAADFFPQMLKLVESDYYGETFNLFEWQKFVIMSLHGWIHKDTGYRRFHTAYVEMGKGQGKSPLAAGLALFHLIMTGEQTPHIFCMASSTAQAQIVFNAIVNMILTGGYADYEKDGRLTIDGGANADNISYSKNNGFIRLMAYDPNARVSGYLPSLIISDELHETPSSKMLNQMVRNTKNRKEPLTFIITNSGQEGKGPDWEYYTLGMEVVAGNKKRDKVFYFITGHDPGDDPYNDESIWIKSNPSLDEGVPGKEYLRTLKEESEGSPVKKLEMMRYNFNQRGENAAGWIAPEKVKAVEIDPVATDKYTPKITEKDLKDAPAFVAFDLSKTTDLTAAVVGWDLGDKLYLRANFWMPKETLMNGNFEDDSRYVLWEERGYINTTPGPIVNYEYVCEWLKAFNEKYNLVATTFDSWNINEFLAAAERVGVTIYDVDKACAAVGRFVEMSGIKMYKHPQKSAKQKIPEDLNGDPINGLSDTLWMPGSINKFESRILNERIYLEKNPCLVRNILSAKLHPDPSGNRRFDKLNPKAKIDGAQASAMVVGLIDLYPKKSVYTAEDFRIEHF